jgi:hypothetical protein
MRDTDQKPFHLKSIIQRDENGNVTKISVMKADRPRFHTLAYNEIVKGGWNP